MVSFEPIGVIRTPHEALTDMPIQPAGAADIEGSALVHGRWADGLADLNGFSHIVLLYHFHQSQSSKLRVTPFMDDTSRGLFATRAPKRPNPIGMSIVRLLAVEGPCVRFLGADMLDGTPLLDIKPWTPEFRADGEIRRGWLEGVAERAATQRSDDRFTR